MSEETHNTYKYLKRMVAKEFRRVRHEQGLSIEEAAKLAGIITPNVITKIEEARSNHLFAYFKLLHAYHKKIKIELVD